MTKKKNPRGAGRKTNASKGKPTRVRTSITMLPDERIWADSQKELRSLYISQLIQNDIKWRGIYEE